MRTRKYMVVVAPPDSVAIVQFTSGAAGAPGVHALVAPLTAVACRVLLGGAVSLMVTAVTVWVPTLVALTR